MKTLFLTNRFFSFFLIIFSFNFLFLSPVWGLDYPNKPINLVVPFGPGGPADLQARILAEAASKELGVPIVVVNKPGPAGALGASLVAKEKPDGYTFLVTPIGTVTTNVWLFQDLSYKKDDFIPVFISAISPNCIAVKADSSWTTFKDFVDAVKKNPGKVRSGSAAPTISLLWESLLKHEGWDITHLMYKSAAQPAVALMGGHIDVITDSLIPLIAHIEAGGVRLLAIIGSKRIKNYPNVPTLYELGYKTFAKDFYITFFAPAGLPQPVMEKFVKAFEKVLSQPNVQNQIERTGLIPTFVGPAEFSKLVDEEYKFYRELTKGKKWIRLSDDGPKTRP